MESGKGGVLTLYQTEPSDSQMLTSWPTMRPHEDPLKLTQGARMEMSVKPNMGPMQAPNSVPPVLISDPKPLQSKATPVAIQPNITDMPRSTKASFLSDMFCKRENMQNYIPTSLGKATWQGPIKTAKMTPMFHLKALERLYLLPCDRGHCV